MKNNGKSSVLLSWPVIIAALIVFWPVGLVMLFLKTIKDKRATSFACLLLNLIGIAALAFTLLCILMLFDEYNSFALGFAIFCAGAGVALITSARKIKNNSKLAKKYSAIIVNDGVCQLDTIADITGKSYNEVKADICKLIDKGYLKNAYVNENVREVVFTNKKSQHTSVADVFVGNVKSEAVTARIVECPCCGANNNVTSDNAECDYCGSAL